MATKRINLVVLLGLAALWSGNGWAQALIPAPRLVAYREGSFQLDHTVRVVAPDDFRSGEIEGFLKASILRDTGVSLGDGNGPGRVIELRLAPSMRVDEAYRLRATSDRVTLEAANHRGLFWAVQTLRQLLRREGSHVSVPAVDIDDAPQYAYRGHMLDVGRHFMPVEFIKKQIDLLSYYKLNTFRWHLTEDQGWRIEIKKYPRLTEVGAWRTESDGSRYGGFYTQEQIRDVVEYARLRNIMVIPEIEMPGHASAALAAYPELSCRKQPIRVPNSWGVFEDVYCVGDEFTFEFLENVLDEVIALFPAPYLHIGGDEAPKDRWKESASSQQRMRAEGLKDERELQSYFVRRIQRYLQGKGKILVGWDEILEGGADRDAIIEVWRGDVEGAKALANGNRIIVAGPFYLDSPGNSRPLEAVYRTDLLAPPAHAAHSGQVLGAEAPLWTEHVTPMNAEAMLYPRLLAFAEVTWTAPPTPRNYSNFKQRLQEHYRRLESWNVAYGPEDRSLIEYRLAWNPASRDWTLHAQSGFDDMRMHYTLDGSEPSANSPSFTDALAITEPSALRVAPFRDGRQAMMSRRFGIIGHLALGAPVTYSVPADPKYWQGGSAVLVDGLSGGESFSDGLWAGWQGKELAATIDLQKPKQVHSINARFLQQSGSWILLPQAVRYSISSDGKRWKQIHERKFNVDAGAIQRFTEEVKFETSKPLKARYVRMKVDSPGLLPESHGGAGNPAYFFVDEIVVK